MPASGGNRKFSNPSCCGTYRCCVSWNGTNAWQFHTLEFAWRYRNRKWRQQHRCSACEIFGVLCPSDKLMEHQEQWIQKREKAFRVLNQPPERTFVHKRSYSLPVLETPSGSIEQRERRWPLHFCEFYNGRSLLRFEMMRNMWSRTWLTKLIAQRAEICKFNPCLCSISSSSCFEKVSHNRNIVTRTSSIQLVTLLPFWKTETLFEVGFGVSKILNWALLLGFIE